MRGQAIALLCATGVVILEPLSSAAYTSHDIVVPDPPPRALTKESPLGQTTGGKSDLLPTPVQSGTRDGEASDPHDAPRDAIIVPEPRAGIDDVRHDLDALPPAVAEARRQLIEAARTGDIEALRPIFDGQLTKPLVDNFSEVEDPVEQLRNQSGDPEGREILAILLELLEAGYVHIGPEGAGTYVWPYFAEVPLTELEPPHYVELYRILTSLDVEEMQRIGSYTFFRVGISHDGRIRYFSSGLME